MTRAGRPAPAPLGLLAALLAGLLGLAVAGAPPGRAARRADLHPVRVVIDAIAPPSATPADTVTVSGTLINTGPQELGGLALLAGVGPRLTNRGQLATDLKSPPALRRVLTTLEPPGAPSSLAAGESAPFTLRFSLKANGLAAAEADVLPLQVRVDGSAAGVQRYSLGQADTFLPYFPGPVSAPLRVSWLWPLDGPPALDAAGRISQPDVPATFGAGGRLQRLLSLGSPPPPPARGPAQPPQPYAPVTWVVEPSLLQTADAAGRDGWRRTPGTGPGSRPAAGSPSASPGQGGAESPADPGARRWSADLAAATAGRDVLALPYGDPDAVAEVRAGLTETLVRANALGRATVAAALPRAHLLAGVGWPAGGAVDQATVEALSGAGDTTVVLDGAQLPPGPTATVGTPSMIGAVDTRGAPLRALAADPDAARLLAAGGRDAPSARMAVQRLLALLALVVDEAPNSASNRDLLLAPPRGLDPPADWGRMVLHDTAAMPWLRAVPLSATAGDPAGNRAGLQPYPAEARAAELPVGALAGAADSVDSLQNVIGDARSMLPDDALTRPLDEALDRAASVGWRPGTGPGPAGSTQLRRQVAAQVAGLLGGVRVAAAGQITLTSRTGTVPVTVENSLDEPVSVRLALVSADRTKLRPAAAQLVSVPAGHKQRVLLAASTQRAGTFRVQLDLSTPGGRQISTASLVVHSTAYGLITLAITLSALAVLVLALLIRVGRRLAARAGGTG